MGQPDIRKELEDIDTRIVDLVAERVKLIKAASGPEAPIDLGSEGGKRDEEAIRHVREIAARDNLDAQDAERIFRQVLFASRGAAGPEAAFQGEDGAHAQEVAFSFFGRSVRNRQCDTIEDVFRLVQGGSVAHGIVPVENSQEGSIGTSFDLLLESNVMVCGEAQARISYGLAANKSSALNSIKKIYAHPQALAQCQAFLRHLGCELVPTYHTNASLKMVKEKKLSDSAVVASEAAAFNHDMRILAREIEDNTRNTTRFFVLGKQDAVRTGRDKTSIVVLLKHQPGTVFAAVKEFAERSINLTKVETRPTRKTPWEYHFYLDFEGHRSDAAVAEALEKLRAVSQFMKILGSYPRASAVSA